MSKETEAIVEALQKGEFSHLVGMYEGDQLECKRAPYHLISDVQKLELAKDICSFANAGGGLLLVGFATIQVATHGTDRIEEVTAFPRIRFDVNQYRQVIESWIWPKIENIDISIYQSKQVDDEVVAVIAVRPVPKEVWPALTIRTINENGKRVDHIFGCFVRRGSHTSHLDARALHQLIRDGHRHDEIVREELASLRAAILDMRGRDSTKSALDHFALVGRVSAAVEDAGLSAKPYLLLFANPRQELDIQGLFDSKNTRESKLVSDPPRVRNTGFQIKVDGDVAIHGGQSRRALDRGGKLLEVYGSGTAIFLVRGDRNGLSWAMEKYGKGELLINQLALVEYVYLFVRFTYEMYEGHMSAGSEFDVELHLSSYEDGREFFKLRPYSLDNSLFDARVATAELIEVKARFQMNLDSPERAAYILLGKLYKSFGLEGDKIPYTKEISGHREIDTERLGAV